MDIVMLSGIVPLLITTINTAYAWIACIYKKICIDITKIYLVLLKYILVTTIMLKDSNKNK